MLNKLSVILVSECLPTFCQFLLLTEKTLSMVSSCKEIITSAGKGRAWPVIILIYEPLMLMVCCWGMSLLASGWNHFIFFRFFKLSSLWHSDAETPGPIAVLFCVLNFLLSNLWISFRVYQLKQDYASLPLALPSCHISNWVTCVCISDSVRAMIVPIFKKRWLWRVSYLWRK